MSKRDQKITDITRRDIVSVLDPIRERGAEVQANRVYALIRRIMNFGVERGALQSSPATHIKMTKERARNRILADDEIRLLFKNFKQCPAIRFNPAESGIDSQNGAAAWGGPADGKEGS